MTEFTLPHGDLLIASDQRDWVEGLLSSMAEPSFVEDFNKKVNIEEANANSGFWTELGRYSEIIRPYRVKNGVLTIPVKGMLMKGFPYQARGYATGYEYILEAVKRGVEDEDVAAIHLDVNAPGGTVAGCFDCVDSIFAMRGTKPITAYANESAYSAAYAIASAADDIVVARTGGVGSIGVMAAHMEVSKGLEQRGVTVTLIYAGDKKADGHSAIPLSDRAKADMQARADALHDIFVSTVARNRGLDEQAVRNTEAASFMAPLAVENGLADAVGPLGSPSASADHSNDDEEEEMSKDNQSVALADHEQAVANATAAGTETGKAAGATAERERINAILGSEEAKTRPAAANHVALNSDMSVEAAASFLKGLPEEKGEAPAEPKKSSFENAMETGQHPNVGDEVAGGGDDDDAAFLATFRASRGRTA